MDRVVDEEGGLPHEAQGEAMIFIEVEVACDTANCRRRIKTTAQYCADGALVIVTPPHWTTFWTSKTEHHCPSHGPEMIARFELTGGLYQVGKPGLHSDQEKR
jgi:hypothetical protein